MTTAAQSRNETPDIRDRVSKTEWKTRVALAQLYRIAAYQGLEDLTYNHFAARVPDAPDHFLIKPTALLFSEVTASNLCCYDLDGNLVYDTEHTSSPGGFLIHASVLDARADVNATIHLHTTPGAAVSALEGGLMFISQASFRFYGNIGYHRYEGLVHRDEECPRLVRDLADNKVCFLENHGTLVTGRSIPECYLLHHFLERACQIQIAAMSTGAKLTEPPAEDCEKLRLGWAENRSGNENEIVGDRDWAAMVRAIDRVDTSYRE
ncbi:MAG: class II aldolase/adducin family protein [Alphaproteobacteria bacterium]|nr:class II aldolase/adducin family protein [Alphaproteobacteria bacterium]